jgi:flavin-dependent dehydrogenase
LEVAQYDLIVVGAGPAGSACAITAARTGARVLLLDKDRFPRQKVCGEFVSPESLELLHGLLEDNRFHSYPQMVLSRIFLDNKALTLPLFPPAQCIPRFDLDAALFHAAGRARASVLEGVAVREVHRAETFHVVTEENTFTARAVVNTTGRWSKLTQFDAIGKDKWLGLKAHFSELSPPQSVDLYFFPGGYCGITPVGADAANACAMVRADVAHTLEEVFALEPQLRQRSRGWKALFPTITTSPLYFREPETESNGMMLAGDSAGFIDPFAGDGISLALQSGALAAKSISLFLRGGCSLSQAQQQYHAAYHKRFRAAFRNAAYLRGAFAAPKWLRTAAIAFARMPGVANLLVRRTRARSF